MSSSKLRAALVAFGLTHSALAWAGIDFNTASELALREVPGGVVTSIERETKKGRAVLEVEVDAPDGQEHELVFDAETGELLSHKLDD